MHSLLNGSRLPTRRTARRLHVLLAPALLLLAAGCDTTLFGFQPDPVTTPPPPIALAEQCGRSLGVAVRCNMVRDQADFSALRVGALAGLRGRTAPADFPAVQTALDSATLQTMSAIGACNVTPAQQPVLQNEVRTTLAMCTAAP